MIVRLQCNRTLRRWWSRLRNPNAIRGFDEPVVRLGSGAGDAGVDEGEDLQPPGPCGIRQGGDLG
jgi:hypothetical protein